jgi:hypothetical protein
LYAAQGFVVRAVLPDFFPVSAAGGAGRELADGRSTSALLMEHNRPRDGVCMSANPLPAAALPRP